MRVATATVSLVAALLVWPQMPRLLALPSPRDLARSNAAFAQANASLETTIAWRTHELSQADSGSSGAVAGEHRSSPRTATCASHGYTIQGRPDPGRARRAAAVRGCDESAAGGDRDRAGGQRADRDYARPRPMSGTTTYSSRRPATQGGGSTACSARRST